MILLQFKYLYDHILRYPTARSLGILHGAGALLGLFMVLQVLTGLLLSMRYVADAQQAFAVIESFIRDVEFADVLRYLHANGASFVFMCLYAHVLKAVLGRGFGYPRTYVWMVGAVIYILCVGAAFMGYVLVWGQMSYWALVVITNLISVIPLIGTELLQFVWGGPCVSECTLIRFYSLHFLLPLVILALAGVHLLLLHLVGNASRLPGDVIVYDKIPFGPYFIVKDVLAFLCVLVVYCFMVAYSQDTLGHPDNYIEADACVTPPHIVPEWYLLFWYGVLRSIPNKVMGVIAMAGGLIGLILVSASSVSFRIRMAFQHGLFGGDVPGLHMGVNFPARSFAWCTIVAFILNAWLAAEMPIYPWTHLGLLASLCSLFG